MKLSAISTPPHLNKVNYTNIQKAANATTNSVSQQNTKSNFGLYSQDIKCKISFSGNKECTQRAEVIDGFVEVVRPDDYETEVLIKRPDEPHRPNAIRVINGFVEVVRKEDDYYGHDLVYITQPGKYNGVPAQITKDEYGNLVAVNTGATSLEEARKQMGLNLESEYHPYGTIYSRKDYSPKDGSIREEFFQWNPEKKRMELVNRSEDYRPGNTMEKHAAETTANAEKRADKRLLERPGTQRVIEKMKRQGLSADKLEQIALNPSGEYDKYETRAAQELLKEMQ